jgi:hypothetical protein
MPLDNLPLKINKFKKLISSSLLVIIGSVLIVPSIAFASSVSSSLPFTDPDSSTADNFGQAISLSDDGTVALVTAPNTTVDGNQNAGAAYIYVNTDGSWGTGPVAILESSSLGAGNQFGSSGSISSDGTKVVVGALNAPNAQDFNSGAAYVFTEPTDGWSSVAGGIQNQSDTLYSSDGASGDLFGESSAISSDGSTIVEGADVHASNGQNDAGEAYVYSSPDGTWNNSSQTETTMLTPELSNATNGLFGISVSTSGDGSMVIIGASGDGGNSEINNGTGYAVAVTEPTDGWSSVSQINSGGQTIVPTSVNGDTPMAADQFGQDISISQNGTTAVIGSPLHTDNGSKTGVANEGASYVYTNTGSGWTFSTELNPTSLQQYELYGISSSVSPDGSSILVGASGVQENGNNNVGEAFPYTFNSSNSQWVASNPLVPATSDAQQDFGFAVSIVNNAADGNEFVGAPGLTGAGSDIIVNGDEKKAATKSSAKTNGSSAGVQGAVYLFDTSAPTISSISPAAQSVGNQIDINGSHLLPSYNSLDGSVTVSFKGSTSGSATIDSSSTDSQLVVTIPSGAKSGKITVTTPNGKTTASYNLGPVINGYSTSTAGEGQPVTIVGTNLANTTTATLNGESLTITGSSSGSVKVTLPLDATSGFISITTANGGAATSPVQITVNAPSLNSVATKAVKVGSTIKLSGTDLAGVKNVIFKTSTGNVSTIPTSASKNSVSVVVPTGAITGPVTVTSASGSATTNNNLNIN